MTQCQNCDATIVAGDHMWRTEDNEVSCKSDGYVFSLHVPLPIEGCECGCNPTAKETK